MRDIKNRIFFKLRNRLKLSRKIYAPPFELKAELRGMALERYDYLEQKYKLKPLRKKFNQGLFDIQLYHLDLLETFASPFICHSQSLEVFDPGCDNWHYLPALWHWAKHYCPAAAIDGMEIDPWRMYINGHTKKSFASGIIQGYDSVQYICGNSLSYSRSSDFIFSSLPFVEKHEARRWQLPARYFDPQAHLEHLWEILAPGGILLVVNIDEQEWRIQQRLFTQIGIDPSVVGESFESALCHYPTQRRVSVICK